MTDPGGLRVACAQLAARDLRDAEAALAEALQSIEEAARQGADLVVLPECSYPAYVLAEDSLTKAVRGDPEVEAAFAERARSARIAVMVGLAQGLRPGEGRRGRNVAVLFDAEGRILLRTAKRFLWDFDRHWFEGGNRSPVVELEGAPVGALVCADLRMPEIARSLSVRGARLILDPTAWVSTGRDAALLTNPQPEFLISVRALENGAWIAAANKVGVERGSVVYCGRSCVVAPDGSVAVMAGSRDPEVVSSTVDLSLAAGPPVARRPDLYGPLARPVEELPVWERVVRPTVASAGSFRVGLLQADAGSSPAVLSDQRSVIDALRVDLVAATVEDPEPARLAVGLEADLGCAAAFACVDDAGVITVAAVAAGGAGVVARPSHGGRLDAGGTLEGRTVDLGEIRLGLLLGAEGLVPEVARVLTLEGAELLLWFADRSTPLAGAVARARALEERAYVALLVPGVGDQGLASVVDPEGRVIATGLEGRSQLVVGAGNVALARAKEMAPGTDVIRHRQPEAYDDLITPDVGSSLRGRGLP